MFKLQLPEQVDFSCPGCKAGFTIPCQLLHERDELFCPICASSFAVFEGLSNRLRGQIYNAVRNHLEGRVYEQQQLDKEHYFEDLANL